MSKRAVLLVNLGSPASPAVPDVRRYLHEFLGDPQVIDRPWQPLRWLLVHGIIVPRRAPKSAHAYARVWTPEGAPLVATSRRAADKLGERLGDSVTVALAMRYGAPALAQVVSELAAQGIEHVLLFPQYPHHADSSRGTLIAKALAEFARLAPHITVATVPPFYADADYIEALHAVAAPYFAQPHDHVLFSYHGIPIRHLRKADPTHAHCTASADCCTTPSPAHATCYKAHCLATTRALAARAGLHADQYSVAFQSRLVGEPWLAPYTDAELTRLAAAGKRRLLVLTPAFVTDCLETLEEIAITGRESFLAAGGNCFQHIPCLNDHPAYIDFLAKRTESWLSGDPTQLKRAASQTDSPCRRDFDPCGG